MADFKNLSRFFYLGLKTSNRLKANLHPVVARLQGAG
jgi:hypothetical protein